MRLLVFLVPFLVGCAALDHAVPALGVAHDVARAGCAILAAVESEDIDSERYESFAKLLLGEKRPDRVG